MLQARVTERYGRRSSGGGKFQIPKSAAATKGKIADLCRPLLDFHAAMKSADSDEGGGVVALPDDLRKQLRRTIGQVAKLVAACSSDG